MPAFAYRSILLHVLPDKSGWVIFGIRHGTKARRFLATLDGEIGAEQARQFADRLAKNLAGKPAADVD